MTEESVPNAERAQRIVQAVLDTLEAGGNPHNLVAVVEGILSDTVFVCSNAKCRAVYASDPRGHCPTCDRTHLFGLPGITDAVGFSTSPRAVLDPSEVRHGRR